MLADEGEQDCVVVVVVVEVQAMWANFSESSYRLW
jgi:hypothetical protein